MAPNGINKNSDKTTMMQVFYVSIFIDGNVVSNINLVAGSSCSPSTQDKSEIGKNLNATLGIMKTNKNLL